MLIESAADVIAVIALGSSVIAYAMLLIHFIRGFLAAPLWERLQALIGIVIGTLIAIIMKVVGAY